MEILKLQPIDLLSLGQIILLENNQLIKKINHNKAKDIVWFHTKSQSINQQKRILSIVPKLAVAAQKAHHKNQHSSWHWEALKDLCHLQTKNSLERVLLKSNYPEKVPLKRDRRRKVHKYLSIKTLNIPQKRNHKYLIKGPLFM